MVSKPKPVFFASPEEWRAWLEKNNERAAELWVGFHKKDSGKPSITWPESVDGALCFGWIDGIRKSLNQTSYVIRFTPRRPQSFWSAINIKRVQELTKLGLMCTGGKKAFEQRTGNRSEIYAYEQRKAATLSPSDEKQFAPTKPRGSFSSRYRPGIEELPAIGWSALKKKRRAKNASPS